MSIREFRRAGHAPTLFSAFFYFDISFMVWVILGRLGQFLGESVWRPEWSHASAVRAALIRVTADRGLEADVSAT